MRIFLLLTLLAWAGPAWAATNIPVNITATTMSYSQAANTIVFSGKVHMLRRDFEVWSDTLTVLLEPKEKTTKPNPSRDDKSATQSPMEEQATIKKVIASGTVRLKTAHNRTGTCGLATYETGSELLTMEKNPVLVEGKNTVSGDVIKLYSKENRSEVLGGKKRVEAIFMTTDSKPGQAQ